MTELIVFFLLLNPISTIYIYYEYSETENGTTTTNICLQICIALSTPNEYKNKYSVYLKNPISLFIIRKPKPR